MRGVVGERAVGDGHNRRVVDSTADADGRVAGDRAVGDGHITIGGGVDAAAGPAVRGVSSNTRASNAHQAIVGHPPAVVGNIPRHRTVDDVEGGVFVVVDAAATAGCCVSRHSAVCDIQRATLVTQSGTRRIRPHHRIAGDRDIRSRHGAHAVDVDATATSSPPATVGYRIVGDSTVRDGQRVVEGREDPAAIVIGRVRRDRTSSDGHRSRGAAVDAPAGDGCRVVGERHIGGG